MNKKEIILSSILRTEQIVTSPAISDNQKLILIDDSTSTSVGFNNRDARIYYNFNEPIFVTKIKVAVGSGDNKSYVVTLYGRNNGNEPWSQVIKTNMNENAVTTFSINNSYKHIQLSAYGNGGKGYAPNNSIVKLLTVYGATLEYSLIQNKDNYFVYQNNKLLNLGQINIGEIKSIGMTDLSLLDKVTTQLEPAAMANEASILLTNGKVYKKTVNLQKHLDIRSMKVEAK